MATVTISDLREHIETDLTDDALTRLLDGAVSDVEGRFGTDAAVTEERDAAGLRFIRLMRPATSITSVVEKGLDREVLYTLDASDYTLRHGGRLLERLTGGNNARYGGWAPIVEVVYTPAEEEVIRNLVIIDLVRLDISYEGLVKNTQVGDHDTEGVLSSSAYRDEREAIMARLSNRRGFRIA